MIFIVVFFPAARCYAVFNFNAQHCLTEQLTYDNVVNIQLLLHTGPGSLNRRICIKRATIIGYILGSVRTVCRLYTGSNELLFKSLPGKENYLVSMSIENWKNYILTSYILDFYREKIGNDRTARILTICVLVTNLMGLLQCCSDRSDTVMI